MGRKSKRQWEEVSSGSAGGEIETPADGSVDTEENEGVSASVETSVPVEQTLDLHDAARRWVPGFKEHWWPGIKRHADSMGFSGTGTEDQCKAVLRHWGAKI